MVHWTITACVGVPASSDDVTLVISDDKDVRSMTVYILYMQVIWLHRFMFSVQLYNYRKNYQIKHIKLR